MTERLEISTGRLRASYLDGSLRYIRWDGVEVLRQIYAAVRDRDWNTIPIRITEQDVRVQPGGFEIVFHAEHRLGSILFEWRGAIRGRGGSIEAEMDGIAGSDFWSNRIGFCVLHPGVECAGLDCTVEHNDGSLTAARFPSQVSPHQPFFDVRSLIHTPAPGVTAKVTFEGDIFETEDQRNWTDDSFKTYSTPLALPFPRPISKGQRIRQRVCLDVSAPTSIRILDRNIAPFPHLGLGACADGGPPGAAAAGALRELRLHHLRADVRPHLAGWEQRLSTAAAGARAIGAALEVAVHLSADAERELRAIAAVLADATLDRLLVYEHGQPAPSVESIRAAQSVFDVPVGAGSDSNFAELNRNRTAAEAAHFLAFAVNPQVHGSDEATIVETIAGQAAAVRSALALGGLPVAVSPVTLKPRPNTAAAPPSDPRQREPFTAAWTLASIASLAQAGASSITYFETAGPRGVMDPAGAPYPVYRVFSAVASFEPDGLACCVSSNSLEAAALVLTRGSHRRIVLANLTPESQDVIVHPYGLQVSLEPYGVTWIDK